ncbi:hypothetical protein L6261_03655 [Candidatus Parcubacteria bacterium]|nr:hypothetical protein [Candidatus Parcubacteria bacterium]
MENIASGFKYFYKLHKKYPTVQEIDNFEFLPSARSIQRKFGGVVAVRKYLKLSGQHDLTKGEHSSKRASKINRRASGIKKEVSRYLVNRFGARFVRREYFIIDDKRTRIDFFVNYKGGKFLIDVFYPNSRHNLIGCLNSKLKKYNNKFMPKKSLVIFLQMNDKIDSFELERILKNKKNKLKNNQHLMGMEDFEAFCRRKEPLEAS